MSFEILVKRTIYVAKCPKCGDRRECTENPPRERLCACETWVPYVAESFTGPELKK
jgi:hypothetical protein